MFGAYFWTENFAKIYVSGGTNVRNMRSVSLCSIQNLKKKIRLLDRKVDDVIVFFDEESVLGEALAKKIEPLSNAI